MLVRLLGATALALVAVAAITNAALAQTAEAPTPAAKPLKLDYPNAPPATVEVDLSFGLFSDLFGLTDATLQGAAEAMARFGQKNQGGAAEAAQLTAKQAAAVQKVLGLAKESIRGVQIRVYEDFETGAAEMMAYYNQRLIEAGWERVLRVNDGDEKVQIALRRGAGAIRGALIQVLDGDDAVVALVECDLSPAKAKQLADTVTTTALDLGLAEVLQKGLQEMRREIARELK